MSAVAHKSLAEALLAFQAEAPTLKKDAENKHFGQKYAPLDTIVETIRPLLAKHGLTWSSLPCFAPNGDPALRYELTHVASGETKSEIMPLLLGKRDPQAFGSALTYARRQSTTAVLNLVAEDDDDGARSAEGGLVGGRRLTAEERNRVLSALADADQNEALVFASVGVARAEDLTTDHALKIREHIDKVLASGNGAA